MKPVECTSAQSVPTSATTNCKNSIRKILAKELRENAWRCSSVIYLGLVHAHTSRPEAKMC